MPSQNQPPVDVTPRQRMSGTTHPGHDVFISTSHSRHQGQQARVRPVDLDELELKRLQLESQIRQFIRGKQIEYDALENELYQNSSGNKVRPDSGIGTEGPRAQDSRSDRSEISHIEKIIDRGRSLPSKLQKPKQLEVISSHSDKNERQGSDPSVVPTPTLDKDPIFAGLFTPHFLPLLEGEPRPQSAPPCPPQEELMSHGSPRQRDNVPLKRSLTEPSVIPQTRKSALKKLSTTTKKRVSLVIDNEIVRPSETPRNQTRASTPASPDTEEADTMPNVTMKDEVGDQVLLWVPHNARAPLRNEDPVDYCMAVGGTMHSYDEGDGSALERLSSTNEVGVAEQGGDEEEDTKDGQTSHTFNWSTPSGPAVELGRRSSSSGLEETATTSSVPPVPIGEERRTDIGSPPNMASPPAIVKVDAVMKPRPAKVTCPPATTTTSGPPLTSPVFQSSLRGNSTHSYVDDFNGSSNQLLDPDQDILGSPPRGDEVDIAMSPEGGPAYSFVGGINGSSGVDGSMPTSLGYPSSLGASYMESFALARSMGGRDQGTSSRGPKTPEKKNKEDKKEKKKDKERRSSKSKSERTRTETMNKIDKGKSDNKTKADDETKKKKSLSKSSWTSSTSTLKDDDGDDDFMGEMEM